MAFWWQKKCHIFRSRVRKCCCICCSSTTSRIMSHVPRCKPCVYFNRTLVDEFSKRHFRLSFLHKLSTLPLHETLRKFSIINSALIFWSDRKTNISTIWLTVYISRRSMTRWQWHHRSVNCQNKNFDKIESLYKQ